MGFPEYVFIYAGVLISVLCACSVFLPLWEGQNFDILSVPIMDFDYFLKLFWSVIFCVSGTLSSIYAGELRTGTFWHLSDLHVDREYSRSGDPNDLCHESANVTHKDNGMYGNFLCESPWELVDLTLDSMKKIEPEPDFIIWTGDNLPHTRNPHPSWEITFREIRNVTSQLLKTFPGIPVYPCIGNHDTFPPNILQPEYNSSNTIYDDYLEKGMWNAVLPESSLHTFRHGGFYSAVVTKGLRIISLNTIIWYSPNPFVKEVDDPSGQLEWLKNELQNALDANEMVYIIGHVPPGFYNRVYPGERGYQTFHSQFLKSFMDIVKKYHRIIYGQFYGHLHNDMFQIYHYDTGEALSSALLGSSVTPWHSNTKKNANVSIPVNPSIRLIQYSKANWLLLDYHQYYFNLTKANKKYSQGKDSYPKYELLYTFCKAYDVPDLSTGSLVAVYEKLKSSPTLFQKFFNYLTAGKFTVPCDSDCTTAQLCSMSCTTEEHYHMCMQKPSTSTENSTKSSWMTTSTSGTVVNPEILTYTFLIGFVCLVVLILGAFLLFYCRKKIITQKRNYIHLSSM